MRDNRLSAGVALLLLTGILAPTPAQAYIGPGVGVGAIAAVLGVLGSILAAILGIIYYPIKRRLRARKKAAQSDLQGRNAE